MRTKHAAEIRLGINDGRYWVAIHHLLDSRPLSIRYDPGTLHGQALIRTISSAQAKGKRFESQLGQGTPIIREL